MSKDQPNGDAQPQFDSQARAEILELVESVAWGDVIPLDRLLEDLMTVTARSLPANYADLEYGFLRPTPEQIENLTPDERAQYVAQQIRDVEIHWSDGAAKIIHGILRIATDAGRRRLAGAGQDR